MGSRLELDILPQPDDSTCGPTCLHAVYRYHGDPISLQQVIDEVPMLEDGGTFAVNLACHALRRGYDARIYTYNLQIFDPTWFAGGVDLLDKLRRRSELKQEPKMRLSIAPYLEFLEMGGEVRFEDLTGDLLRRHLSKGLPILTGLSSTYLYRNAREYGPESDPDDLRGDPAGHFVVLAGYDRETRTVVVADPYFENPVAEGQHYEVPLSRVIGAVFLGVLTYDANLLLVRPRATRPEGERRRRHPGGE